MAKKAAMTLGVVFIVVGLLGFVNDPILGLFEVDAVHNIIHLVTGIAAVAMAAKGEAMAKKWAQVFGVIYALVAVLGLVVGGSGKLLGLIEVNTADHVLHVVLALVILYVGFGLKEEAKAMPSGQM